MDDQNELARNRQALAEEAAAYRKMIAQREAMAAEQARRHREERERQERVRQEAEDRRAREEARKREKERKASKASSTRKSSKKDDGEPGIVGSIAGLLVGGIATAGFTRQYSGDYEILLAILVFMLVAGVSAYIVDFIVRHIWWLILLAIGIAVIAGMGNG